MKTILGISIAMLVTNSLAFGGWSIPLQRPVFTDTHRFTVVYTYIYQNIRRFSPLGWLICQVTVTFSCPLCSRFLSSTLHFIKLITLICRIAFHIVIIRSFAIITFNTAIPFLLLPLYMYTHFNLENDNV